MHSAEVRGEHLQLPGKVFGPHGLHLSAMLPLQTAPSLSHLGRQLSADPLVYILLAMWEGWYSSWLTGRAWASPKVQIQAAKAWQWGAQQKRYRPPAIGAPQLLPPSPVPPWQRHGG